MREQPFLTENSFCKRIVNFCPQKMKFIDKSGKMLYNCVTIDMVKFSYLSAPGAR